MYTVYLDKQLIHDLDSENNVLVNPTLNLELNKAGTFEFSMECTHPFYDKLERFKSIIQVLCDGDEIFKGRIIEITDDMYKERTVYCESELAYLNDSIQRPFEYHLAASAVYEYLQAVIGSHNGQVDDSRQFTLGEITVNDPNDYIYCYTNYNSTMDEIKEDLVDDLGGYIRIRNEYRNNDPLGTLTGRYIDYINLEEYGKTGEQRIEFGENLLDFTNDINQADICTGIIPLGATLEESEYSAIDERVTIESVNSGSDYLTIPEAVEKYGLILKVVTWDDITEPGNLKTAAENYLAEYDYEPQTITATAVDMHLTDEEIESWRLGDKIFVESEPHDLHKRFPLAQMSVPLDQPENTSVTLGTYEDTSLSGRNNKTEAGLRNFENFEIGNVIASAVARASAIIDQHTSGYVTIHYDEDRGCADEILIMDAPNIDDATRVWRWNLNGLGYSSNGYHGDYGLAMTMDGWILGSFIIANGMILADDNDDTFGHFDSEGMKIYRQSGKSDELELSITKNGMTVYGANRTTEFTDGQIIFTYNSKEEGRLYAPGGYDGVWFELGGELEIFGDNVLIGKNDETDTRVLRVENAKGTINLGVSSGGNAGLYFSSLDFWLLQYEIGNAGTLHIGGETDWLDAISINGNTTVHGTLAVTGNITMAGNLVATQSWVNGLNVSTFNNDVPYATANDVKSDVDSLTSKINDVSSNLDSNVKSLTDSINGVSSDLSSFESDVSNNYALKSEIPTVPSNVSAFTNDAGYITSNDLSGYVTNTDLTNTLDNYLRKNAQMSYSISNGTTTVTGSCRPFTTGLVLRLEELFDGVSGGDITCSSLTVEDIATGTLDWFETHTAYSGFGLGCGNGARYKFLWWDSYDGGVHLGFGTEEATADGLTYVHGEEIIIGAGGSRTTVYGFTEGSDERLKTSIQPLSTSSLDNLTPVSFKWRDGDDRTHYGYIAQEVQPYFPELVSEGTDGMLGLAYTEIIPLLHCKIKEQQAKIDSLEERIAKLEALINGKEKRD